MAYTTINKYSDYFNTKLYTGTGADNNAITGVGFQPDLVWLKSRSVTEGHYLQDAERGATRHLHSMNSDSEVAQSNALKSFNSDGFTLGDEADINTNNSTNVSWNWLAATAFSNSAGANGATIASTGRVNTTAGFSMTQYAGNDTSGATVYHGLGAVPKMIIIKRISGSAQDWIVYHGENTSAPETDYLMLNQTNPTGDSAGVFNDTAPTSAVFSLGNASSVNGGGGSDNFIAYCFAEKTGYSKFGSYTGNGVANGPFVYTGFAPEFVITKGTGNSGGWEMHDRKRSPFNSSKERLFAHSNNEEVTEDPFVDLLSNGFKCKTSDGNINAATTYVYMAFGQSIVGTNDVPCTARI